ncbi:hypothetical protein F5051DRAFT_431484 [Lentinula edodes]|nr:hypothetical protein F5051DRAFT_431484 [Lentinula edodes]
MSLFSKSEGFVINGGVFTAVAGDLNYGNGEREGQDTPGRGLEILYQAAVTGASHDAEQRFPPPNCYPGTRIQILEILKTWINNDNKSTSIYWIYGAAGVGKSAVAQTISETFAQSTATGRLAASFFFSRADSARNNLSLFFITIAHQLAISPVLGRHVGNSIDLAIRQKRNIVHAALEHQFQELIVKPCSKLRSEEWKSLPRLIVIDGLDECLDIASQERLLSIIRQSKTSTPPLPFHFLICSRPEPRIRNAFSHPGFRLILDCNDLGDSFEFGKDIANYFRDEFGRIRQEHGRTMAHVESDWPGDGIIQQLVQRACGQFIYATTVLKYVGDYHGLPTERLEIIMNITVPEDFDSPYPDLDLLYMQILSMCKNRDLLLHVMGHLLKSDPDIYFDSRFEQKTTHCIEGLFFLQKGKASTLFFGLHSVLVIPEDDHNSITIRHASFVDFLTDRKRSGKYYVDIDLMTRHEQIALYLLKRITYSIKNTHKLSRMNSEFDTYAWDFWYLHCRKVARLPSGDFLIALYELDPCGFLNTAMRRRNTSLEACVSVLRNCLRRLDSIAQWSKALRTLVSSETQGNPSTVTTLSAARYRLFQDGFRVQIPSSLQPREKDTLKRGISVLKYDLLLYKPNMWDVISDLTQRHLSSEEVGAALSSSWPCPTIVSFKPESQPQDMMHPLFDLVDVYFSSCQEEIVLQCLQIIREPSQSTKEVIIYSKFQWINHLSETTPNEGMLQVLLKNLHFLQTSEDAKKALKWVENLLDISIY